MSNNIGGDRGIRENPAARTMPQQNLAKNEGKKPIEDAGGAVKAASEQLSEDIALKVSSLLNIDTGEDQGVSTIV